MAAMYTKYNMLIVSGLIVISVFYIAVYNILGYAGMPVQKVPVEILYLYQQKKALRSDAELAFVGDSSLGNAINAELFSKLWGHTAENFALIGGFGYRGSLDMLKTVKSHDPRLKTVILMQTTDMLTRKPAPAYHPSRKYFGLDLDIFNYSTLRVFYETLTQDSKKNQKLRITNDYIAQGAPLSPSRIIRPLSAQAIRPGQIEYLKKFAGYCREQGLRCFYAHGPGAEEICDGSRDYLRVAGNVIEKAGLTVISGTPVCIPRAQLGDASDHVGPAYKNLYTRRYFALLKTKLAP
jgi:hypothetical protein